MSVPLLSLPPVPPFPLESQAQDLYNALAPMAYADEENQWTLAIWCEAMGNMGQQTRDLAYSDGDHPGWTKIVDVDRCPAYALAWLAQLVGVRFRPTQDEAMQRDAIRQRRGWRRGKPDAIIAEVQDVLTGTKAVFLRERDTSAYHFTIVTFNSETPDAAAVVAAVERKKPGGVQFDHLLTDGDDWNALIGAHDDWDAVVTAKPTWDDVVEDPI